LETIEKRIRVFEEETLPTIRYYEEKGLVVKVDANRSIEDVWNDVLRLFLERGF